MSRLYFPILMILSVFVGCGPKTVPVSGIVSFDGVGAADIRVIFQEKTSAATVAPPAIGLTDKSGKFTLQLSDGKKWGAVPGEYVVLLAWADPNADPNPIEGVTVGNPCPYKIPTRAKNGSMTFTVPASGKAEANFEFETAKETFEALGI